MSQIRYSDYSCIRQCPRAWQYNIRGATNFLTQAEAAQAQENLEELLPNYNPEKAELYLKLYGGKVNHVVG